jgi:hypothetical protein
MITFLVGGARSGKSSLAVEMGVRHQGPVVFIATAEAFDADLATRIARHRHERPEWPTIEAPIELGDAVTATPSDSFVIVDCLTVWLANLFHHLPDEPARRDRVDAFLQAVSARTAPTVVISNEVGLGLHPETALGRDYRDELGRLNQRVAAVAQRSLLLVAGRALPLTDPWKFL